MSTQNTSMQDIHSKVEHLMSDEKLIKLCELQRIGDEALDVISLYENQHSEILAWLFDSREGHGQGDDILRDFLVASSSVAASQNSGLDRRCTTSKFFNEWPPSRIRTTGFGSAFIARELGMNAKERVDLFIIDPQNQFVILIENKAGATHTEEQLDKYRNSFLTTARGSTHLSNYAVVCIALDREYSGDTSTDRPASKTWLHINYEWLKTSANRALTQVVRGNTAARLVVSYCNRQTGWESPNESICSDLAADLHETHPDAIRHLIEYSHSKMEIEWIENGQQNNNHHLFALQNKSAINILKKSRGISLVKSAILKQIPSIKKDNIFHKRAWLDVCPSKFSKHKTTEYWPVYLGIRFSNSTEQKYQLAICWDSRFANSSEEAQHLRQQLSKYDDRFSKHGDSLWRRVNIATDLSLTDLVKKISEIDTHLQTI